MSKAQELIKKEGLVGMIITDPYNMRRISGFRGGEGALYISATQQVLITDSRYTVWMANGILMFMIPLLIGMVN